MYLLLLAQIGSYYFIHIFNICLFLEYLSNSRKCNSWLVELYLWFCHSFLHAISVLILMGIRAQCQGTPCLWGEGRTQNNSSFSDDAMSVSHRFAKCFLNQMETLLFNILSYQNVLFWHFLLIQDQNVFSWPAGVVIRIYQNLDTEQFWCFM